MRAFIKFNQGIMKMPVHWQLWLMVLITFNLVIPLFLLSHGVAQVVVGVLVARRAAPWRHSFCQTKPLASPAANTSSMAG